DFKKTLHDNKDIEAVVIALPLHWHARCAVDCMRIGQARGKPIHVLCEKLMGWNISQCKQMIQAAKETGSILSIGHQRRYSLLYACSIFLGKVHPLAVTGIGGTYFYGHRDDKNQVDRKGPNARQSDDHVFITYEFPGKNHPLGVNKGTDESDVVVVTYSSINT